MTLTIQERAAQSSQRPVRVCVLARAHACRQRKYCITCCADLAPLQLLVSPEDRVSPLLDQTIPHQSEITELRKKSNKIVEINCHFAVFTLMQ